MDVLLTTQQAAHVLKRSARTIYRLMQPDPETGEPELKPVMRIGEGPNSSYLFAGADVEALLQKRAKKEAAAKKKPNPTDKAAT